MIPWTVLDVAPIPGGNEHLKLMRRGEEFSIRLGVVELMNSRLSGSEEALAARTCERLDAARPRILIGGLGMGFTLRAALAVLGAEAEVVVAELVPAVVAWARGPMAELFAGSLEDPRVTIVEGDVGATIGDRAAAWDAILLGLLAVWSEAPDAAFVGQMRGAGFVVEELRVRANAGRRGARHVIWIGARGP